MHRKRHWTRLAVASLACSIAAGDRAHADTEDTDEVKDSAAPATLGVVTGGSHRGVAQDYIVLPAGGELTAQMRFVTAEPVFGDEPLRFSDLALFGLSGRWSLFSKLELSAHVELLPKQPSYTDEKPWQSVGGALRSPLGKRVALAITGAGGHLIAHEGMWLRESVTLQWRKPIHDVLTFGVAGGLEGLGLRAPGAPSAFMSELSMATTALFRMPNGVWGAWIGLGYAIPVTASGADPTTGLAIDPQPRLDLRAGTVVSLVKKWDLFAEFAIVDRGDLSDPSTRMPVLDGGFDQRQFILGVTRHIDAPRRTPARDPLELSQR